jgi:hypothetical protein
MMRLLLQLSRTGSTSVWTYKLPGFSIRHGHTTGKPGNARKVKQNTKELQVFSSGRYSASEAFTPAKYEQLRQLLTDAPAVVRAPRTAGLFICARPRLGPRSGRVGTGRTFRPFDRRVSPSPSPNPPCAVKRNGFSRQPISYACRNFPSVPRAAVHIGL